MTGKVKWFNAEKGFGFILSDDGQDIFAHFSQIQIDGYRTLDENDIVEFDIDETDRGLQAMNIVKI